MRAIEAIGAPLARGKGQPAPTRRLALTSRLWASNRLDEGADRGDRRGHLAAIGTHPRNARFNRGRTRGWLMKNDDREFQFLAALARGLEGVRVDPAGPGMVRLRV